jgi:hypothetical protein
MEGSVGWGAEAPYAFLEDVMGRLTLRDAVVTRRLDAFVSEQQADGAELATGSELERGLALLITQHRLHGVEVNGEHWLSVGTTVHLSIRS